MATTMMSEEEKAEIEKQMNSGPSDSPPKGLSATPHVDPVTDPAKRSSSSSEKPPVDGAQPPNTQEQKKRPKMTPEQKKKLAELEEQRVKAMEERVQTLTKLLIERLRPFVDAQNPGGNNDPETEAFQAKMKKEAEDLKLESFGIEVCYPFLLSGPADEYLLKAAACDRIGVRDESNLVHEVKEIPWHVSPAVPLDAGLY